DYQYMINEILNQINITCAEAEMPVPNIFTEFGSFTVGESGGAIYEILYQKQQNDREKWNMINSSFITTDRKSTRLNSSHVKISFFIFFTYTSLFRSDYQYMINEILNQINITCAEAEMPVPNIFTEFGSFTVGESGGAIYEILYQKQQNDREKWNMINSSFIT